MHNSFVPRGLAQFRHALQARGSLVDLCAFPLSMLLVHPGPDAGCVQKGPTASPPSHLPQAQPAHVCCIHVSHGPTLCMSDGMEAATKILTMCIARIGHHGSTFTRISICLEAVEGPAQGVMCLPLGHLLTVMYKISLSRMHNKVARAGAEGSPGQWAERARVGISRPQGPRFLAGCRDGSYQGSRWPLSWHQTLITPSGFYLSPFIFLRFD